jgi:hypothetical protein
MDNESSESFAEITRAIIEKGGGVNEFLPTVFYPGQQSIRVLEGLPEDADIEREVLDWAREERETPGEHCLVAFRYSSSEFKVVRMAGAQKEHKVYVV